ncbi:class I SAM-dependent methyltransferase [Carboxylicivirga marina]|uniref:class I SAM-dependent methyltransferase n=1 Tax=Carboxylicivirga marina TaxID=2800988 RepID=UPI00259A678E|nr:class I SAM-dependent methyltransferase [uncultured Carboxylicivirga sp.]
MKMEGFDRKKHWDKVYETKNVDEVSWYQPVPETSLNFLKQFNVSLSASIIDIGGGDSFLVDHLLDLGYRDVTVLDISANAIERAKKRLGNKADRVKWIVADAASFVPSQSYDFWHDRAAFHFLTEADDIANYLNTAQASLTANGVLVIGTFSEQGPNKCSGINIKQYSEVSMTKHLSAYFEKIKCIEVEHQTPFDTVQSFVFCSFKKK